MTGERSMGEIISELRKEKGMTQRGLAEKMKVTDKAVSKWERDIACPDINSLPRLARILGVSVDELLTASHVNERKNENITDIILKAVPLAVGIAVIVMSAMRTIDLYSGLGLLGIGITCIAVNMIRKKSA